MDENYIVNGVDVKTCNYSYPSKWSEDIGCEMDECFCKHKRDCYFKQLARAKEENEELKKKIKEFKEFLEDPKIIIKQKVHSFGVNLTAQLKYPDDIRDYINNFELQQNFDNLEKEYKDYLVDKIKQSFAYDIMKDFIVELYKDDNQN